MLFDIVKNLLKKFFSIDTIDDSPEACSTRDSVSVLSNSCPETFSAYREIYLNEMFVGYKLELSFTGSSVRDASP